MAIYYVDSTATGTNAGTSWVNAYVAFGSAVTAATGDGDFIYISHAHNESLAADTTYTFANNVQVLCVNSGTGALATTAVVGAQSVSYGITLAGAYKIYIRGITFKTGGGFSSKSFALFTTSDGVHAEFEECAFWLSTSHTGSSITIGSITVSYNHYIKFNSCVFRFTSASTGITPRCYCDFIGCSVSTDGAAPNVLVKLAGLTTLLNFNNCDFSSITGTLVGDAAGYSPATCNFYNCSLGNSVLPFATQTAPLNKSGSRVRLFNCAAGDVHYAFGDYDSFGQTVSTTAIYANSGAKYDGSSGISWEITTTAYCSYWTPYVSPWIQKYHSGTTEITPRLEILRDGSATAYTNAEVWGEFSYQGTSGSPLGVTVNDRMTPLGTPAAQGSSSLGASDWTGENATAWFGKLEPASVTPAEIGHLMARVVVGKPSTTVYVDPTIRTS